MRSTIQTNSTRGGRLRKLAKATGFGAAISLLICCVLPIAASALLGASLAAPLAGLDQPWIILGSALAFGTLAFLWQESRR